MIIKKWLLAVSFRTLKATFVLRNCLFFGRFYVSFRPFLFLLAYGLISSSGRFLSV